MARVSTETLRSLQASSLAVSSFLDGLQAATRRPGADVKAYVAFEREHLRRVTDSMLDARIRPSALNGLTRTMFGLTGAAFAALPPRIRHACIGGMYDALGSMHTEHLRDLLEQERQEESSEETSAKLKDLNKSLRDARASFGAPEGAAQGGTTELLLQSMKNKDTNKDTNNDTGSDDIDAATLAATASNLLLQALARVSKTV